MNKNQKKLQNEVQNIRTDMEKLANKKSKRLLRAYKRALDDIRKEIGGIYAKHAKDGQLDISKKQRCSILKSLQKQIKAHAKEIGLIDEEITTGILKDVYLESYYKTLYTIDKGVNVSIDFSLLNPKIVEKAVMKKYKGKMFSDRIWNNKKLLIKRLKREIEKGIIQGDSIDRMARRVKKQFGSSAYESKRLIHNEMTRVVSEAQANIYKDSDVVKKVMYDATIDDKTSDKCQMLDGEMFDPNSDYPRPPDLHTGCRSCIIPVIEGWQPTKKKDNDTKEIIEYKTYTEWKKSRDIE